MKAFLLGIYETDPLWTILLFGWIGFCLFVLSVPLWAPKHKGPERFTTNAGYFDI